MIPSHATRNPGAGEDFTDLAAAYHFEKHGNRVALPELEADHELVCPRIFETTSSLAEAGGSTNVYAALRQELSTGRHRYQQNAASVHQSVVDAITGVALLVVFVCALTKTALGISFRDGGETPLSGNGGGPRPLSAPVLRPHLAAGF